MRDQATAETIEAVWRLESTRLVAGLVRMVRDIGLAEDLAQDAMVAALAQWPTDGIPDNPGAWLIGAWLELAYLYVLSTNKRFQNAIDATQLQSESAGSVQKLWAMLEALAEPDRQRYRLLERRCQAIL